MRPPSATHIVFSKYFLEYIPISIYSSSGVISVLPLDWPRGFIEIFFTWSKLSIKVANSACPASWYASISFVDSENCLVSFARPICTFSIASSMTSPVISYFFFLTQRMAASFRTFLRSAPDIPTHLFAISKRSMSLDIFFSFEWTYKIYRLPSRSGNSTLICLSKRPGLFRASSSTSGKLVAAKTTTPELPSKPSISVSN